jgi:predicted permease
VRRLLNRLLWLSRRGRREAEIRAELEFHLEEEVAEGRAAGLDEPEARRAARLDLGNPAVLQEDIRDAWGWAWLEHAGQDVRYAGRLLRRRPAFSVAAILTLALGIGGATAVFSLYQALLVRHLPVERPDELVRLIEPRRDLSRTLEEFTIATHDRLREASRTLSGVIGSSRSFGPGEITIDGQRRLASWQRVSDNYFDVLGVGAQRGRVFHEPGAGLSDPLVAVISADYWRTEYASSTDAIGARFHVGNREYTIVGVAQPGFRGTDVDVPTDIWMLVDQLVAPADEDRARGRLMHVMGRLASGTTPARAAAEVSTILGRPFELADGAIGYSRLRGRLSQPLLLVAIVVGFVLLIACANLANLMLAGTKARERELSVRTAIGASRMRVVRQLLTEGVVLASAGGLLALGVAAWISGALLAFLPPDDAAALPNLRFTLDAGILGFAALLTCGTCLLFTVVPALRATGRLDQTDLRSRTGAGVSPSRALAWRRCTASPGRGRLGRMLLVGQVVLCTALLIVASVFVRTLGNLRGQDAGYVEDRLLVADVQPPRLLDDDPRDLLLEELRMRIEALPGVDIAAFSHIGQLDGAIVFNIGFPDRDIPEDELPSMIEQRISIGFLRAMGNAVIAGRDFTDADTATAPLVAIVNESFARQFFPGEDPIGRRFYRATGTFGGEPMTVVGVVRDAKWVDLRDAPPPMYYRPYRQMGGTPEVRFAIRTDNDPSILAGEIRGMARAIDPRFVVENIVPFREIVDRTLVVERLTAHVSTAFGALALLIAAVGLYGVLAYNVAQRRREIGVRIAIGARPRMVEWMFLRESLALLGVGVLLGLPVGIAITRFVASMLYGLGPQDPASIGTALIVLTAATAAASYLPARRAATVDPVQALRQE